MRSNVPFDSISDYGSSKSMFVCVYVYIVHVANASQLWETRCKRIS